jgi:hypothetical protein
MAHYYLHPDVTARQDPVDRTCIHLGLSDGRSALLRVSCGRARVSPATWHPEFGCCIENRCVVIEFEGPTAEVEISW